MADHAALIARLEALTGPDREVDALVALSFGWRMWKSKYGYWNVEGPDGTHYTVEGRSADEKYDAATGVLLPEEAPPLSWAWEADLPEYTASLDAVIALVERELPGWQWHVSSSPKAIAVMCRDWDDDYAPSFWSFNNKEHRLRRHTPWHKQTPPTYPANPAIALCLALLRAKDGDNG